MCLSSSVAAKKVGSNQDLVLQIIICLPVKTILRFKSLSKTYLSLVKELDPHLRRRTSCEPVHGIFLRMVREEDIKNNRGSYNGCRDVRYKHQYIPLNPIKNRPLANEPIRVPTGPSGNKFIVQSSNGLFLCFDLVFGQFQVYNPTTLSYTTIPNHPDKSKERSATLAFDPITSLHYKIILATYGKVYVYSSETGTWSGSFVCKIPNVRGSKNGVYWNGSVHWMVTTLDDGIHYYHEPHENSIRFHVVTQTTHIIPEPLKHPNPTFECNRYFGETRGHLHYIDSGVDNLICIQEMKTDYSEWFVKYRVNLSKIIKGLSKQDYAVNGTYHPTHGTGTEKFRDFEFLSVTRSREEKAALLMWVNNKVVSCNPINLKFKTLAEFSDGYEPGPGVISRYVSWDQVSTSFELDSGFQFIPSFSDT